MIWLDNLFQRLYRLGYPLALFYCRLIKCSSHVVQVAFWVKGSVLLVKNSYRDGYSLPGGDVKKGEGSFEAACRELVEETGVEFIPDDLTLAMNIHYTSYGLKFHAEIFECRAEEAPAVQVDNREVVEALFFKPQDALDLSLSKSVRKYLRKKALG